MTDFSDFQPSEWTEDGVFVIPVKPHRVRDGARKLVRDFLLPLAAATAVALSASSGGPCSDVVHVEQTGGFVVGSSSYREFASTRSTDDVDPRVWARVATRMDQMKPVEVDRDFDDEPDPFI